MASILALIEGTLLFGAAIAGTVLTARPVVLDWLDLAVLAGQAGGLSVSCLVAFYYNDFYDLRVVPRFSDFAVRLLQSLGVAVLLLAAFYYFFPETRMARGALLAALGIVLGVLLPLRAAFYASVRRRPFVERILLLGRSPVARALVLELTAAHAGYVVLGLVDDADPSAAPTAPVPPLGPLARLDQIIAEVQPDRIVVTLAERRGRLPVQQLLDARARGVLVEDGVELYERLTGKLAIEALTPSTLIFSRDFRKSRFELAASRAVSLVVAAVGLVASAPLLGLIALAVKLDSPGPVFFVQDRIGRNGERFELIKFRTMRPSVGPTPDWVRENMHRVTRVGKWLRTFRMDELPQFVNILRGDLNLVGPRPIPASFFERFLREIPYYSLRSIVRPGVTGWAQIRYGYANDLEQETEKMRYDLYFIKHLSLWFDLRILIDTVKIVLLGHGAQESHADRDLRAEGATTR